MPPPPSVGPLAGLLALALTCGAPSTLTPALGQTPVGEEQRRLVEVRRQQVEVKAARGELERVEELSAAGLVSKADLERARTQLERVQLDYQEAVLALASSRPRLTVVRAVKAEDAAGRKFVRLIVANRTPGLSREERALLQGSGGPDPLAARLANRDIEDVFASLRDTGAPSTIGGPPAGRGITIALPYEHHIPLLRYGQSRELVFQLLKDVDSVVLVLSQRGEEREIDIQLQQDASGSAVSISSTQISQEADLGAQATFDLLLSRSTVDVQSFQLQTAGLPRQLTYSFIDPTTQARLSRLSFPAGVTQRRLELRVFLPQRADQAVVIDRPIRFWAIASPPEQAGAFAEERPYTLAEIRAARAGAVQLEIIPRGVGRIEVLAASLYSEIAADERLETELTIKNAGTRRLDNVRVLAEPPTGWRADVAPSVTPLLDPAAEQVVRLTVVPPPDVRVGDYEVRIDVESFAYNRRVPAESKVYRISIKPRSGVWSTGVLVLLFLAIVAGVVWFGIKLTRR